MFTVSRTGKGTLSGKIASLWDGDKATLNANVPEYASGSDTSYTPLAATWTNNLYALWSADGKDKYIKVTADGTDNLVTVGANNCWFYFAPEQPKVGDYYLKVVSTKFKSYVDEVWSSDLTNDGIEAYGDSSLVDWSLKGILGNQFVYATKDPNKTTSFAADSLVASLGSSAWGSIVLSDKAVAKEILNLSSEKNFHLNIAFNYGQNSCFAAQLTNAVNKYYFLRPINVVDNGSQTFKDGEDVNAAESNINVLDIINFSDWRGTAFANAASGDYSHVGYFNYYGIKSVEVLLSEAKTNVRGESGSDISKWGALPAQIKLSHKVDGSDVSGVQEITYTNTPATSNVANSKHSYSNLVKNFGLINYYNNGYNVVKDYKIVVPVKITYTFGTLKTNVEFTVKATKTI